MHISLACFSDEVQALDTIISCPHLRSQSSLPIELLLHIRLYLLVHITDHLIIRSYTALQRYESTLRQLLCAECLSYNQYVYGEDVWHWTEFTGACRCDEARRYLLASPADYTLSAFSNALSIPSLNPKRFVDRQEWLEHYLSCKSLRFTTNTLSAIHPHSQGVIWDLVATVLDEFRCRSIRKQARLSRRQSRAEESEVVLIVPAPDGPSQSESSESSYDDGWMTQVLLRRVERDLVLKHDYQPIEHSTHPSIPLAPSTPGHSSECLPCHSKFSRTSSRTARAIVLDLIVTIHTTFTTILCLPVSLATLLLTLICYYCKPQAFRTRISV
ncbi:hypothetical protein VNI00_002228 [Paramarasmius palmivorus]|uniref:Uncharacterized protein n=1 Tax=Paramarasmius palmivorus TaxID=297713 RepID=A0AAW0E437_9AGAR